MQANDNKRAVPRAERGGTEARRLRSAVMLHEDCLNVRLSDYLESRRLPAPDTPAEPLAASGDGEGSAETSEEDGE